MYVKPELMKRVSECFPDDFEDNEFARNQCRDRILECISCSRQVCVFETLHKLNEIQFIPL